MASKRSVLRKIQLGLVSSHPWTNALLGKNTEEALTAPPVEVEAPPVEVEVAVEAFRTANPTLPKNKRPTARKTRKTTKTKKSS
tara:strand:- start:1065 stop:1316 length:252 start_codon:yes stop_codon:yes gene_type:complete